MLMYSSTELKPFFVADTETLLVDNVHMPCAAGLWMVPPGKSINDRMMDTYFHQDHTIVLDFEERTTKVLPDLVLSTL